MHYVPSEGGYEGWRGIWVLDHNILVVKVITCGVLIMNGKWAILQHQICFLAGYSLNQQRQGKRGLKEVCWAVNGGDIFYMAQVIKINIHRLSWKKLLQI